MWFFRQRFSARSSPHLRTGILWSRFYVVLRMVAVKAVSVDSHTGNVINVIAEACDWHLSFFLFFSKNRYQH